MSWRDDRRQHVNSAIMNLQKALAILQPTFFGDVQSDARIDNASIAMADAAKQLEYALRAIDKSEGNR